MSLHCDCLQFIDFLYQLSVWDTLYIGVHMDRALLLQYNIFLSLPWCILDSI